MLAKIKALKSLRSFSRCFSTAFTPPSFATLDPKGLNYIKI